MNNFGEKVSFIWSVADLIRGPYRPNQYKEVMLPLTVLRRLDCVLEPTKDKVLAKMKSLKDGKVKNVELILYRVTGMPFYNTSRYTFEKLKGDPNNIAANLTHYIKGFSTRAREIIEHFGFEEHIAKLDKADRLYLVVKRFCDIDLHPDVVKNIEMGQIFEELIRKFNEASNEEAGDHFTPRKVIRLMVNLLFMPDSDILTTNGSPLFTGSAGSGESEIRRWIIENDWLEAIVALPDQLFYNTGIFTYLWIVTNRKERSRKGKIQLVDGTSFFKKMRKSLGNKRNEVCDDQRDEITRLYGQFSDNDNVRVFDNADFGYRRITVERPLKINFCVDKDRIVRLEGASAFARLATTKKRKDTKAAQTEIEASLKLQKVILAALYDLAPKGVIKNREEFSDMMNDAFKKARIKIPAGLFKAILMALAERDEEADVCTDSKGNPEPDPQLRDYENVPLKEDMAEYVKREVLPHVPDAWIDESKTKIGYEINFNRYFYEYTPPRPLEEIETDLKQIEKEIADMLSEVNK